MLDLAVFLWIHICSMAMLIGGMTFVFLVLRPALSRRSEETAVKEASAFVRARFRLIAVFLTAAVIASGILNIIFDPPKKGWIVLLIGKVLLAGAVLYLYFRNAFGKLPKGATREQPVPSESGIVEGPSEWKTTWLLSPTSSQVKIELIAIGGALIVALLGVILVSR